MFTHLVDFQMAPLIDDSVNGVNQSTLKVSEPQIDDLYIQPLFLKVTPIPFIVKKYKWIITGTYKLTSFSFPPNRRQYPPWPASSWVNLGQG